jgi:hypothetical protein
MLEKKVHQLTADEIRGRNPEEVTAYLQEKSIHADSFEIPKELFGMFTSPRAAHVFATWVGKHMNSPVTA